MELPEWCHRLKNSAGRYYWDLFCKDEFLKTCPHGARVLDVGCGNDSPISFKRLRPDFKYVGLDISDYNQRVDPISVADEYIVTSPEAFASRIEAMPGAFDAVVSAHNIEHCNEPDRTLEAMLRAIKSGGRLYLSFPSEAGPRLPSRRGTLNFYDDPTHRNVLNFRDTCATIERAGFRIDVAKQRYRPLRRALRGLLMEPRCFIQNTVTPEIWALYGFESIIWATHAE